jgi:hypothetical protein
MVISKSSSTIQTIQLFADILDPRHSEREEVYKIYSPSEQLARSK